MKLGTFSEGKIDETDEGDIVFGIAADYENGVVILNFESPVAWLGLPPDLALALADKLREKAEQVLKAIRQ